MKMKESNSYVYFAFKGDNFDPDLLTNELGIQPTNSWRTGEQGKYIKQQQYSCWELRSTCNELLDMDKLVEEVVDPLVYKIETIKYLKEEYKLDTILQIIMYIDVNEEKSTPFIGQNSRIINFLCQTGTTTDVDIYRYDSSNE